MLLGQNAHLRHNVADSKGREGNATHVMLMQGNLRVTHRMSIDIVVQTKQCAGYGHSLYLRLLDKQRYI